MKLFLTAPLLALLAPLRDAHARLGQEGDTCTDDNDCEEIQGLYCEAITNTCLYHNRNYHWVACGGGIEQMNFCSGELGEGNFMRLAADTEEHEIRCCTTIMVDGVFTCQGSTVCYEAGTYSDAETICSSRDRRVCTMDEVKSGCVAGTGCDYDLQLIWTSRQFPCGTEDQDCRLEALEDKLATLEAKNDALQAVVDTLVPPQCAAYNTTQQMHACLSMVRARDKVEVFSELIEEWLGMYGNPNPLGWHCFTSDDGDVESQCQNTNTGLATCCDGEYACDDLNGILCIDGDAGSGACNGFGACYQAGNTDMPVLVHPGSCAAEYACYNATGVLGEGSCTEYVSCIHASGDIGSGSCTAHASCLSATADIPAGSCTARYACYKATSNDIPTDGGTCSTCCECSTDVAYCGSGTNSTVCAFA